MQQPFSGGAGDEMHWMQLLLGLPFCWEYQTASAWVFTLKRSPKKRDSMQLF